jgi:hypothetical protein
MATKYEIFVYSIFLIVVFGFIWQFTAFYLLSSDFYMKLKDQPGVEVTTKRYELEQAQKLLEESMGIGENLKRVLGDLRWVFRLGFRSQMIQKLNDSAKSLNNPSSSKQTHLQHEKLHQQLQKAKKTEKVPSFKYEQLLRRIRRNIKEFFNFAKYEKVVVELEFRNQSFWFPNFVPLLDEMTRYGLICSFIPMESL